MFSKAKGLYRSTVIRKRRRNFRGRNNRWMILRKQRGMYECMFIECKITDGQRRQDNKIGGLPKERNECECHRRSWEMMRMKLWNPEYVKWIEWEIGKCGKWELASGDSRVNPVGVCVRFMLTYRNSSRAALLNLQFLGMKIKNIESNCSSFLVVHVYLINMVPVLLLQFCFDFILYPVRKKAFVKLHIKFRNLKLIV